MSDQPPFCPKHGLLQGMQCPQCIELEDARETLSRIRIPLTPSPSDENDERERVARIGRQIAFHMEEISNLLAPQMKITLLMRHPANPKSCAIITDEDKVDVDIVCTTLRELLMNPHGTMSMEKAEERGKPT